MLYFIAIKLQLRCVNIKMCNSKKENILFFLKKSEEVRNELVIMGHT